MHGLFLIFWATLFSSVILPKFCMSDESRVVSTIYPEFEASQVNWIDFNGLFMQSNNSNFGFGFVSTSNPYLYELCIVNTEGMIIVWTANRENGVENSEQFVFERDGNMYLKKNGSVVWSTDTAGKGVIAMELQNSGNLVLLGNATEPIWQSFSHPTDTLLPNQVFYEGMKLVSNTDANNLSYFLEMKSGDLRLYAGYQTPQPYWSLAHDDRKTTINYDGLLITSALLTSGLWRFYGQNQTLVWLLNFPSSPNTTMVVLGDNGVLNIMDETYTSILAFPDDFCSRPEPCHPYFICSPNPRCDYPEALELHDTCSPESISPCSCLENSTELLYVDAGLSYFALEFIQPTLHTTLNSCKDACLKNCSCVVMFFENTGGTGRCFLFDQVGSFQRPNFSPQFLTYVKVRNKVADNINQVRRKNHSLDRFLVMLIAASTVTLVSIGILLVCWDKRKKNNVLRSGEDVAEREEIDFSNQSIGEEKLWEELSRLIIRFSHKDLEFATNNFSVKLGQGGFGSVYKGNLRDGTRIAVKKLEAIGQGNKEFQAEIRTIGHIRHANLIRLEGFCVAGTRRLLVYEYMQNGPLSRWIFDKKEGLNLSWEVRFNIALGVAKALAYLHEGCHEKIVHCDVKPENVLLDEKFQAKLSDFGLVKLMTREQSQAITVMRGTRGYLAPEWITNHAITEKSDVYSFGMVLLEIIGGRRNTILGEASEKVHFPLYAMKMMEEGNLKQIIDPKLEVNGEDERVPIAIKVALWCIQGEVSLRPPMTSVVGMLEGSQSIPPPPIFCHTVSEFLDNFVRPAAAYFASDSRVPSMLLSGPR